MRLALTPARGMEGWVDLGSLIAARPGIKPTTAWSEVRCRNQYTTKPPLGWGNCDLALTDNWATRLLLSAYLFLDYEIFFIIRTTQA